MFKLDDNLLRELGLGTLPADEKNRMLAHIYETLEMRVGMKLAEQMSNDQLDEFEGFIDRNDEAGALKWLETNFPNYKQVVADELEALKGEVKASAAQIVAASQAANPQVQPGSAQPYQAPDFQQLQNQPPMSPAPAGFPQQPFNQPGMPSAQPQPVPPMPGPGNAPFPPQPGQGFPAPGQQPAPQAPPPQDDQQPPQAA